MFKTIEPLDPSKHQDLRLSQLSSFSFASEISAVKLSFSELRHVAPFCPIVFFGDSCIPQALLSFEPGKNNLIDKEGQWKIAYIPVFFRMYPFTLAKIDANQEDKFALCLDPEAEHFKSGMGDPLFTANGEIAGFVQEKVLKSLEVYQNELATTERLFKILAEKELMADKAFQYTVNQEKKNIDGFKGIDMEKLVALDDKSLADMVKNGTMGLVHEHVHSLSTFSNLLTA